MAQIQGTEFQVRLDLPDQMPLTDVELCTVLGNLLDNAVEACSRQKQGVRRIFIAGETRGTMYFEDRKHLRRSGLAGGKNIPLPKGYIC